MKKLPKFLICKNEPAEPNGLFVLHTQKPLFLARAIKTDSLNLLELQKQNSCTVRGVQYNIGVQTRVNEQLWALFVIRFFNIEETSPEIDIEAVGSGGLMSRLGDWFHSYIKQSKNE